jgi:RNA polymerase sigma factor (sigma-70 family)
MSDAPIPGNDPPKSDTSDLPPAPIESGETDETDTTDTARNDLEEDEQLETILDDITHNDLTIKRDIFADCGFTIEELHQKKEAAQEKLAERFLKIAAYRYYDNASFYLPGLDPQEVQSAAGEKIVELLEDIVNYPSLPQLEKAFRISVRNLIISIQRKQLAEKRGEGKVDVTSELQGLATKDDPSTQSSGKPTDENDEKTSGSTLQSKIRTGYTNWHAFDDVNPGSQNERAKIEARRVKQYEMIEQALAKLRTEDRQLIQWFYIEGLKHREIAEKLGKGVSSIGRLIDLAEDRLRKLCSSENPEEMKDEYEA